MIKGEQGVCQEYKLSLHSLNVWSTIGVTYMIASDFQAIRFLEKLAIEHLDHPAFDFDLTFKVFVLKLFFLGLANK